MMTAMTENYMGLLLSKLATVILALPSADFWRIASVLQILPLEAELVTWNLILSLCLQ